MLSLCCSTLFPTNPNNHSFIFSNLFKTFDHREMLQFRRLYFSGKILVTFSFFAGSDLFSAQVRRFFLPFHNSHSIDLPLDSSSSTFLQNPALLCLPILSLNRWTRTLRVMLMAFATSLLYCSTLLRSGLLSRLRRTPLPVKLSALSASMVGKLIRLPGQIRSSNIISISGVFAEKQVCFVATTAVAILLLLLLSYSVFASPSSYPLTDTTVSAVCRRTISASCRITLLAVCDLIATIDYGTRLAWPSELRLCLDLFSGTSPDNLFETFPSSSPSNTATLFAHYLVGDDQLLTRAGCIILCHGHEGASQLLDDLRPAILITY